MPSKAELLRKAMQPKSDQLNGDDLIAGPMIIKVTGVDIKLGDQPVAIHWEGENGRPYKPAKTMMKLISHAWGDDPDKWVGRSMTLYFDPDVDFGKDKGIGGIRISHMDGIEKSFSLSLVKTRGKKVTYIVELLSRLFSRNENNNPKVQNSRPPVAHVDPNEDVATQAYIAQQRKNLEAAAATSQEEFARIWGMISPQVKPVLASLKDELKAKYSTPKNEEPPAIDPNDLLAELGRNGPEEF